MLQPHHFSMCGCSRPPLTNRVVYRQTDRCVCLRSFLRRSGRFRLLISTTCHSDGGQVQQLARE